MEREGQQVAVRLAAHGMNVSGSLPMSPCPNITSRTLKTPQECDLQQWVRGGLSLRSHAPERELASGVVPDFKFALVFSIDPSPTLSGTTLKIPRAAESWSTRTPERSPGQITGGPAGIVFAVARFAECASGDEMRGAILIDHGWIGPAAHAGLSNRHGISRVSGAKRPSQQ